jgi:Cu+-exporting ATPase
MSVVSEERLDLPVEGMTCAACARAVERQLNSTPGVSSAHVNFATHTATVSFDPAVVERPALVHAIEEIGYTVPPEQNEADDPEAETRGLVRRLWIAALFSAPVVVLGMAHGLHAPGMNWIQLALTVPVVFYAGLPFYTGAFSALRHRSANMNTLIALGTGSAFLYSSLVTVTAGPHAPVYFEAAAVIVTLILLGRLLEARARPRFGSHPPPHRLAAPACPRGARRRRNRGPGGTGDGRRSHRRAARREDPAGWRGHRWRDRGR